VTTAIDLDHVALAAADTAPALRFLTGVLGGTVLSGGHALGFRPMQVLVGDRTGGMKVELLEPWDTERNDFLARFVERNGAGPHHLTFKVPNLDLALDAARAAGFNPIGIDRSDPRWQEAFIHPREAHGTVVQIAQTNEGADRAAWLDYVEKNGPSGEPIWWADAEPHAGPITYLRRVVLGAPDPQALLPLYAGLLGGEEVARDADSFELAWPTHGRVRIERRADQPAGVDRLEVEGLAAPTNVIGTWFVGV
jgi:catechol 2,3-dioxygenase-like lactoylglutathione lyase family enzyme